MLNISTKSCIKCNIVKPISEYYTYKKNGRPYGQCKSCKNAISAAYALTHPNEVLLAASKWHQNNPNYVAEWQKRNPEKCREATRKYRLNNLEKTLEAARKSMQKYRDNNLEMSREYSRKAGRKKILRKLKITEDNLTEALISQGGLCSICRNVEVHLNGGSHIHIDHCHKTGRFRGILCKRCNLALGLMKDDPARLIRAAEYLKSRES